MNKVIFLDQSAASIMVLRVILLVRTKEAEAALVELARLSMPASEWIEMLHHEDCCKE
jgi:hypothetical protein